LKITDYAIASDFDGTITVEDSNELLVQMYGSAENARIEQAFRADRMSTREAMVLHFESLPINMQEFHDFLGGINISPGFDLFLEKLQKYNVSFSIISAGYLPSIFRILGEKRLENVQIFANDLSDTGKNRLKPSFFHENPMCDQARGPCGICKKDCVEAIRQQTNKKIIYIGDGLTDRCAVPYADITFAKGILAEYCRTNNHPHIPFETFTDIVNYFNNQEGAI